MNTLKNWAKSSTPKLINMGFNNKGTCIVFICLYLIFITMALLGFGLISTSIYLCVELILVIILGFFGFISI